MRRVPSAQDWPEHLWHPRRDGDPLEFLYKHEDSGCSPLFCGAKQYRLLWDGGYLAPRETIVRINRLFAPHEHYVVVDRERIEGLPNAAYAGLDGIHRVNGFLRGERLFYEVNLFTLRNEALAAFFANEEAKAALRHPGRRSS